MFTVTVLTPKGRRQQVKVTPNTTLLQVLEEVCNKHGLNAEEYDLRHHNKVLDISSIFRFTSLPNNAQLEMTEAVKQRQDSPVTLGLQFESGERLTGVFSPSESVWNVIKNLKPGEEKSSNLVVIYMRQEIIGRENLKSTTLRSLGLTGGRAMLRVLHKSPEQLRTQANVSTNLLPRVQDKESYTDHAKQEQVPSSKPKTSPEPVKKGLSFEEPKPPSSGIVKQISSSQKAQKKDMCSTNMFEKLLKDEKTRKELLEIKKSKGISTQKIEPVAHEIIKKSSPERKTRSVAESVQNKIKEPKEEGENKVILLGDRSAVAYNLNSVKPIEFEDEPDDFYDLTLNDAKLLLKHAKQLCADLEEAPLMTSAQRELERNKKVLSTLHQYKKAVLRIKFPDRTVLQGTFSPVETIASVEKFVRDYLENPKIKFYLYTTPPKVILRKEDRLIECNCVPCSVIYFGMPAEASPPSQYLKSEVLEKLSTPSAACLTAYESRGIDRKIIDRTIDEAEKRKWSRNDSISEAGTSGSSQFSNKSTDQESSPQFKVPKWFKTNK